MTMLSHHKLFGLLLPLSLALLSGPAESKEPTITERAVAAPRVLLGDIADVPDELGDVDLGPAPVPGGSRMIKREELLAALPEGSRNVLLPAAIRVKRRTRTITVVELEALVREAVALRGLSKGATLEKVRPRGPAKVADGFDEVRVEVPKPPRREGRHLAAATLVFTQAGEEVSRAIVNLELGLSKEAAIPDVAKGAKVQVVVRRGAVSVSALATAQSDADVGEIVTVIVADSGKVLRTKVESKTVVSEAK
jgi:hypothetical protein